MSPVTPLLIISLFLTGCSTAAQQRISDEQIGANSKTSGTLVIGNKGEDTVSFVDLASGKEIKRAKTGPNPHEVAISPGGRFAAIVAYGGETIDIFRLTDMRLLRRVNLSPNKRPHGIVWLDDARIMATTEGSDTLTIINDIVLCEPEQPCTAVQPKVSAIATGNKGSHMLAVQADGSRAYVSNLQSKNVSVLDIPSGKKIRDLDAGTEPEGIALTPDGQELWVAARGSNEVFVFDAQSLEQKANIKTGRFPIRIAISPDGAHAVTSDLVDGAITVIDTASKKVMRSIPVSKSQEAFQVTLIFSPDGKYMYLAETGTNQIAEIEFATGTTTRRIPAGEDGDGLGISAVANRTGNAQ